MELIGFVAFCLVSVVGVCLASFAVWRDYQDVVEMRRIVNGIRAAQLRHANAVAFGTVVPQPSTSDGIPGIGRGFGSPAGNRAESQNPREDVGESSGIHAGSDDQV